MTNPEVLRLLDGIVGSPDENGLITFKIHVDVVRQIQALAVLPSERMKSTQAMRDRIRELMSREQDDYDRAVECVLDDLESLLGVAQAPTVGVLHDIFITMRHARTFITSREKMNPTGVELWDKLFAQIESLQPSPVSSTDQPCHGTDDAFCMICNPPGGK